MSESCHYCKGSGYVMRTPKKENRSLVKCIVCDGTGKDYKILGLPFATPHSTEFSIDDSLSRSFEDMMTREYGVTFVDVTNRIKGTERSTAMNMVLGPAKLQELADEWCREHDVQSLPSVAMLTYMAEQQVRHILKDCIVIETASVHLGKDVQVTARDEKGIEFWIRNGFGGLD